MKAKDVIVNGLDGSYIVEKSRPLMLMKTVPFSLGELKVLDTYLSRINAEKEQLKQKECEKECEPEADKTAVGETSEEKSTDAAESAAETKQEEGDAQ